MTSFKLANVLLKREDHFSQYPGLIYHAEGSVDYLESDDSLAFDGKIDFMTYFNAVSVGKWQKYASLDNIKLHIELMGEPCTIILTGVREGAVEPSDCPPATLMNTESVISKQVIPVSVGQSTIFEGSSDYAQFELDLPLNSLILGGFTLESIGATSIRNTYWYTDVDSARIRDIRLAIATTTFKNEKYIIPNIDKVKVQILNSDEPIANAFHMYVVDNGQTLDADALIDAGVTIIPNANTGGAGGFARGMMAALAAEDTAFDNFTHVLLMDDDVFVSPESFIRTFNLLSLTNDKYKDAFINGAMLELGLPNKQFEDVSHVRRDGKYARIKGNLIVDNLADIGVNEVVDVELPNAYGAWWYSCIPLDAVRENGLPLPIFVRCDDVEYGIRCQPTYMTMNGICVWHAEFGSKFRAPVDCYQYIRNYLILTSLHDKSSDKFFMARADRTLRLYLRAMAYETAELMIKGLEDYLKGPEFIMNASGEGILKLNNSMAEQLIPIDEALNQAADKAEANGQKRLAKKLRKFKPDVDLVADNQQVGAALKLWRTLPYDRHVLPDKLLRNHPSTAYYGGYTVSSPDQIASRVLVATDREGKTAHVRFMDLNRFRALQDRWRTAKAEYKKNRRALKKEYKEAFPEMTSVDFWKEYLGIDA